MDPTYRAHALPAGSDRYWSWLFSSAHTRPPLLGIYALIAQWRALLDPALERGVAQVKLAWWQDEMHRLASGSPVHPISTYLLNLPRAVGADFSPLEAAVVAAGAQVGGVPLERAGDLEPHAYASWGAPLSVASCLSGADIDAQSLRLCTTALAAGDSIARSIAGYRGEARHGRVPFAVEELLAAGIDNADLAADTAPAPLAHYLESLRTRAMRYFDFAANSLPVTQRPAHRYLLVLAALGNKRLSDRAAQPERQRLQDMFLAWSTARRAGK